jgi:LPXTG-motif cell wall-anchored protein
VIGQDNTVTSAGGSSAGTGGGSGPGDLTTTGEDGILSGNQTLIGVQVPVNASGNQVTVIGQDNTVTSTGGSSTGGTNGGDETTSGEGGVGSGNQTPIGAQVPVDTSGNQVTVIGQGNTDTSTGGSTSGGTPGTPGTPGGTVSPPATPPTGGAVDAPQAGATPVASSLPNTGLSGGLLGIGLLGLLMLLLGSVLYRRESVARLTV